LRLATTAELAAALSPRLADVEAQFTVLAQQDAVRGRTAVFCASCDSCIDPWLHNSIYGYHAAVLQDRHHPVGLVRGSGINCNGIHSFCSFGWLYLAVACK
jgi:hypothetical protein